MSNYNRYLTSITHLNFFSSSFIFNMAFHFYFYVLLFVSLILAQPAQMYESINETKPIEQLFPEAFKPGNYILILYNLNCMRKFRQHLKVFYNVLNLFHSSSKSAKKTLLDFRLNIRYSHCIAETELAEK